MIETIKTLCRLPGPSGWEDAVRDWIAAEAAPYADQMITDAQGSLLVFKKGRSTPKEPVLLAAHMDEVGVVIREIDDEGYLRFGFLGGVDRRVVIGKRVWIGKNRIPGLIGMKPIHLTTAAERKTMPKLKDLYIDIGAADGDEAIKWCMLLHDCGKPECFTQKDGVGHFYGHAAVSAKKAQAVFARLKFSSAKTSGRKVIFSRMIRLRR